MKRRIISIILAVIMIVTISVSLMACGSGTSVDLNKYMTVETDGYDGYGTAYSNFDSVAFIDDYGDSVKLTKEGETLYSYTSSPVSILVDIVTSGGSLSKYSDLSNGDDVTYHWNISDEYKDYIEDNFNVSLKYSDIKATVDNLEEIAKFDAFDGVSVIFTGTAPNGAASVESNGIVPASDFTVEPSSGLSVGDIVTVTLKEGDSSYFVENYEAIPEKTSLEYTVENLPYFVNQLSQIPDDALDEMDAQARDALSARIASATNSEYDDLAGVDLLGCYLLTPKDGFSTNAYNAIYLVYEVNMAIHNIDAGGNAYDTSYSFYRYYRFTDGMVLPDGTFSINYSDYDIPSEEVYTTAYDYTKNHSYNQEKRIGFYGYDNIDTLFNNVVTQNIENYNYESSVGDDTAEN